MIVKVLKKFRDKNTRKIYRTGEVIEVSEERYKEILEKGPFVEEILEVNTEENAEVNTEENAEESEKPKTKKTTKKSTKKTESVAE